MKLVARVAILALALTPIGAIAAFGDNSPQVEMATPGIGDGAIERFTVRFTEAMVPLGGAMPYMQISGIAQERLKNVSRGLPYVIDLMALSMGAGLDFPGAVRHAEITPLFENACCFAQHSVTPSYGDAEGTPVAILEAGAAGLPVISTLHAGIPDVVVDGVTGFLAGERDVESMAANMVRCLENPEMCRSMGAAARAHVRSNLSLAAHIARLQQAIEEARARQ